MDGISRRNLLKRSAVAGGVLWAAPVLTSGTAWGGAGAAGTCDCDGSPVYTKIAGVAGNDAQTCTNQCLNPSGLPGIGFKCLSDAGYVATTVTSQDVASVEFQSKSIFLQKLSVKASAQCLLVTCVENFGTMFTYPNSEQDEPKDTVVPPALTPHPVFTFYDGDSPVTVGNSNVGVTPGQKVRKIVFDSQDLDHKVDFIEFILCVENLSRIPCKLTDCA
jgi:hypothetical protein